MGVRLLPWPSNRGRDGSECTSKNSSKLNNRGTGVPKIDPKGKRVSRSASQGVDASRSSSECKVKIDPSFGNRYVS